MSEVLVGALSDHVIVIAADNGHVRVHTRIRAKDLLFGNVPLDT